MALHTCPDGSRGYEQSRSSTLAYAASEVHKMRRRSFCATLLILICLAGCAPAAQPAGPVTQTQAQTDVSTSRPQTEAVPTTRALPTDLPQVDFDLSALSGTMMYSQAYDMIYNPDQYLGKTVRILGPFDRYTEEETGRTRYVCLIRDATACCTQGIEFEPADADTAVPEKDSMVLVSGTFDTYMDGPFLYCVLRDAVLEYVG